MGKASENIFWKALKQHINNKDNKKNPIDTKDSIVDLLHADLSDKVFDKALVIEQKNQSKLYKEYYKSYLEKLKKEKTNHNDFFEMYHGAAGYLNGHKDNILIKKYELDSIKSQTLVDIYKNYFKNEFGLILLDIGPDGANMEYGKSNGKPITFVGLTSCLGLVCPGKGGVHLVLDPDKLNIYVERIKFIHELCGNGELIACDPDGNPESHIICFFIQYSKQKMEIEINDKEIKEFFNTPGSFKNSEKVKKYIEEYIKDENVKWYFKMFLNDKMKNSDKIGSTITYP